MTTEKRFPIQINKPERRAVWKEFVRKCKLENISSQKKIWELIKEYLVWID